jgi:hypothetical protein
VIQKTVSDEQASQLPVNSLSTGATTSALPPGYASADPVQAPHPQRGIAFTLDRTLRTTLHKSYQIDLCEQHGVCQRPL